MCWDVFQGKRQGAPKSNAAIPRDCAGVLITTDGGREFKAANEVRNVLNEYYEKIYAPEAAEGMQVLPLFRWDRLPPRPPSSRAAGSKPASGGAVDIAKELAAELEELKQEKVQHFKLIDPGQRASPANPPPFGSYVGDGH